MSRLELRIPPPAVALIVALAMWLAAPLLPRLAVNASFRTGLVAVLFLAGAGIAVSAAISFRRAKTTITPLKPSEATSLVTSGVFGFTRNPMYLGLLLVLAGWAVALSSPALLLGPLVFFLYIGRFQIAPEERALSALFGADYERYKAGVGRWL